jgi:hypothetical protein
MGTFDGPAINRSRHVMQTTEQALSLLFGNSRQFVDFIEAPWHMPWLENEQLLLFAKKKK